jgi:hypothetical protein
MIMGIVAPAPERADSARQAAEAEEAPGEEVIPEVGPQSTVPSGFSVDLPRDADAGDSRENGPWGRYV